MFRPNQSCVIRVSAGKTDMYGQPLPTRSVSERCAVVKLNRVNQKSAVRADSSATRGNAFETVPDSLILLTKDTVANIDDLIEVAGVTLRIMEKQPRFSVTGVLDHYEIVGKAWC